MSIVLASGLKTVGLTEVVDIKKKIKGMYLPQKENYVRICFNGIRKRNSTRRCIYQEQINLFTVPVVIFMLGRVVKFIEENLLMCKGKLRDCKKY